MCEYFYSRMQFSHAVHYYSIITVSLACSLMAINYTRSQFKNLAKTARLLCAFSVITLLIVWQSIIYKLRVI